METDKKIIAVLGDGLRGGDVLAFDAFTDIDGTRLDDHAMDVGSGWTQVDPAVLPYYFEVRGNQAGTVIVAGGGNLCLAKVETGTPNGILTLSTTYGGGIVRPCTRIGADRKDYIYGLVMADAIRIVEIAGGVGTVRANFAHFLGFTAGTPLDLKLTVNETHIEFEVVGTTATVSWDAAPVSTATTHGVATQISNSSENVPFDDFRIVPL